MRSRRNFPQAMPRGSIVHRRRLFRKSLPYGRLFRTEDSSVRKTLPYGRLFRTEESSVRKTLAYGRLVRAWGRPFRTEESFVRKSLSYGRLLLAEDSSARKTPPYGRASVRKRPVEGHALRKPLTLSSSDFKKTMVSAGSACLFFPWRSACRLHTRKQSTKAPLEP